jgi:hypothetical protein
MFELRGVVILAVLMALVFGVVSEEDQRAQAGLPGNGGERSHFAIGDSKTHHRGPCQNSSANPFLPSEKNSPATTGEGDSKIEREITALQRAHWCRMNNGTHIALGQTYIHALCNMCRCTASHAILCDMVQCMATYCIDDKRPILRKGQCCTQCDYDLSTESCVVNGTTYPHGAVIKVVEKRIQCWCQLGQVECRDYIGTLFENWNIFSDGVTIYILAFVMISVLFIGLLACCGFTYVFYNYFKQNQDTILQAYDEYVNPSGWQPLNEEEQYEFNTSSEEKRLEAESYELGNPTYTLPPAYALHNQPQTPVDEQK